MKHTINIGIKSLGVVEVFTGTIPECLNRITDLENKLNHPLQHYEVGTNCRIVGGVMGKKKEK